MPAHNLTKKGYAVLRVDDRGVGQTTGDAKSATSKDFAADVQAGLNYLKSRKEVDKTSWVCWAIVKAALQKIGSKKYDPMEIKGVNHLFQHCGSCTVNKYRTLEETFAPEAMEAIADWLKKNVK